MLTQLVAVLFALEMVGTAIVSKKKLGSKLMPGYELDLLYLGVAIMLAVAGAGAFSADSYLR